MAKANSNALLNNKFNISAVRTARENIIMDYYSKIHNSKKDITEKRQEVIHKLTQTKREKNRNRTRKMKKVIEDAKQSGGGSVDGGISESSDDMGSSISTISTNNRTHKNIKKAAEYGIEDDDY
jgi:hypothetical protein